MLRALAMGPLEQAHCLASPVGLLAAVRSMLLGEPNAGAALALAVRILQEAMAPNEIPAARAVFLALEELGLGTLSAMNDHEVRKPLQMWVIQQHEIMPAPEGPPNSIGCDPNGQDEGPIRFAIQHLKGCLGTLPGHSRRIGTYSGPDRGAPSGPALTIDPEGTDPVVS